MAARDDDEKIRQLTTDIRSRHGRELADVHRRLYGEGGQMHSLAAYVSHLSPTRSVGTVEQLRAWQKDHPPVGLQEMRCLTDRHLTLSLVASMGRIVGGASDDPGVIVSLVGRHRVTHTRLALPRLEERAWAAAVLGETFAEHAWFVGSLGRVKEPGRTGLAPGANYFQVWLERDEGTGGLVVGRPHDVQGRTVEPLFHTAQHE